jgi:hypothetical protein
LSKRIAADASLHAMQGARDRILPRPTGAVLTGAADPQNSDRLVPVRHISAIDRLLDNSLEGLVSRFVNTPAHTHASSFL